MFARQTRFTTFGSLVVLSCLIQSCTSSNGPGGEDEVLRVAGTYTTQVSLTANTCTGITVQSLPTTVAHTAGATTLSLTHGPLTYTGAVAVTGAFTTSPNVIQDPAAGMQTTLTIAGQFSTSGFVADVTANVVRTTPPNCAYTVHWVGTKQGSANTIP